MAKFNTLRIKDIHRETADCVSVAFEIPEHLKSEYKFIQGQYITLKRLFNGEDVRRSYSICSSPITENELRVAVKEVPGGKFSTWLNREAKVGDTLEVMPPMGNFYSEMNINNAKHYVLFAGGSGITPMYSILKTVLAAEPKSTVTLFYANRNEESIIFKNGLKEIEEKNSNRFKVYHILDSAPTGHADLYKGILTKDKVKALIENHVGINLNNEFFICGPTPMMDNVREVLEELKVDKNKIHIEYFTAQEAKPAEKSVSTGGVIESKVTIIMDGVETTINLASNGKTILDAAMDAGLDAPFACKGAVCCTCKAKVLNGSVSMDMNYALTDDEVAEGYILTCQAHPQSPEVTVDYDVL
ncbi:MAG: 1,2-phenylacetyl-CoA epoxidase subunit PaaE [Bacteroidia bacterium]